MSTTATDDIQIPLFKCVWFEIPTMSAESRKCEAEAFGPNEE